MLHITKQHSDLQKQRESHISNFLQLSTCWKLLVAILSNAKNAYNLVDSSWGTQRQLESASVDEKYSILSKYFDLYNPIKKGDTTKYIFYGLETNGKHVSIIYKVNEERDEIYKKRNNFKAKSKAKLDKTFSKKPNQFEALDENTRTNILNNYNFVAFDPGVSDTVVQGVKFSINNPNKKGKKTANTIEIGSNYYSQNESGMQSIIDMQSNNKLTFFRLTKNAYYNDTLINSGKINLDLYQKNYHDQSVITTIKTTPKSKFANIDELITYVR